jgi:hypothetical protein
VTAKQRGTGIRRLVVGLGLLAWLLLALSLRQALAEPAIDWTREQEPVILSGDQLPAFDGAPLDDLFVYAFENGAWQAVPFQFDERLDATGVYTVENGLLDSNDELVFMAMDLGQEAHPSAWIADADSQNHPRYQVQVTNPLSPTQYGWLYVYRSATLVPESIAGYVEWDAANNQVLATNYTLGFSATVHSGVDSLDLNNQGVDVLDRLKFRVNATCRYRGFPLFTETLTEEDMVGQAVFSPDVDGPVRVGGGDAQATQWFYHALYSSAAALNLGDIEPPPFCDSIDVNWLRVSTDWLDPQATGMAPATYYDSNMTSGVPIDGSPDDVPATPLVAWDQVSGALGSTVQIVDVATSAGTLLNYYKDDDTLDPQDSGQDQQSFGDGGVLLETPSGQVTINSLTFVLGPDQPNVGAIYREYYDRPLEAVTTVQLQRFSIYLPLVARNHQ